MDQPAWVEEMPPWRWPHRHHFGAAGAEGVVKSQHRSLALEMVFLTVHARLVVVAREQLKEDWRDRSSVAGSQQASAGTKVLQCPWEAALICSLERVSMTLLSLSSPASPFRISICYRFFPSVALD